MKHSPRVENLIEAFTCLPGVGRRSAQRMTYALLERDRAGGERLAEALSDAMQDVGQCRRCRNFAEDELCPVCADPKRDQQLVCVVASPADVLAIEQSGEYQGRYFVLMGHLSPIDGLGPSEIGLDQLEQQLADGEVNEIILGLGTTVEGEATAHYVRELAGESITVTRIAQGVPMGGDLEFVDGATLAQALRGRTRLADSQE